MDNNHLMFVKTHRRGTNDPDTRPGLTQSRDLYLRSWCLSFVHDIPRVIGNNHIKKI